MPLVPFVGDGKSLDDILEILAGSLDEHVQQRRLCQVLFYDGVTELASGNAITGKQKLQRAVELGSRQVIEHILASAQLERLGGR